MSNVKKDNEVLKNDIELEKLYQIYMRVQSGDKTALNELFKPVDCKKNCRADEINKKYRISHMDNVLDMELVLDNEKVKQEEEWVNSVHSNVTFQFSCLNKMLNKKKKKFIFEAKNTGYEKGQKVKNNSFSKYYEGEYDISDFNELMYETIIEIFNAKTDENKYLTLDGKKNVKIPICDGLSLLKNISYFTSRRINKRAKNSYLDVSDVEYYCEGSEEESETEISCFDKYALKEFLQSEGDTSRLTMYAEYLEWLKRNDVHKLFKATACDINAIIDTIMNCEETFIKDMSGDKKIGFGMHFIKQEMLQKIIESKHNINIKQENISKDLEIIEQRLLDHLLYSLNFRLGKAEASKGIYEKESERFLYELDKKAYIKVFSRVNYVIYDKSVEFINSDINCSDFNSYFEIVKKYEDMVTDIVSLEKGKKKYDMVNLISKNDNDLVDDKREALLNIAKTIITYYQKKEEEYKKNELGDYKVCGLSDWENGFWETELESETLQIKLWSSKNVKKPIRHNINKEKLIVYCGCMNFYFCDMERNICYSVPKDRRIISRANRNHEICMYNVG